MKLVTHKSKNLLYRIQRFVNCTVDFQTSYAVLKQTTADTYNLSFKGQLFKGVDYAGVILFAGEQISSVGKFTKTFTTPSTLPDYNTVVFGLNGATNDTIFKCEMVLNPSTTYTFTCNFTNITQGSVSWKDMMLVEGSTAGEYEPYSYNLLDKWQYPATQTLNGVTFTNNSDGSITANGTNTGDVRIFLPVAVNMNLKDGHYYCMSGNVSDWSVNTYCTVFEIVGTGAGREGETIFKYTEPSDATGTKNGFYIRVSLGVTVNNAIFKPQLYDLTTMYGVGNEPTTVDQFYTDHPELKVSPLGFIGLKNLEISNKNIKRLRYATTTRNLFDINKFGGVTSSISIDGNMLLSTIPSDDHGDIFAFKCTISVKKNTNYIISVQDHSYDIFSCYVYTDELWGNRVSFGSFPLKFNSGDNESLVIGFYSIGSRRQSNVATWIQGPQIEEGSTATYYVPYGYLDLGIIPSNSGYILNQYNNLSEELLEENVEKDTVNYHIPDKTNILLNKVDGKTNKIVQLADKSKYDGTSTTRGITFTNNGNGTITINGTNDGTDYSDHPITNSNYLTNDWLKGRKYLFYFSDRTDLNYYAVIGGSTSKIEYTELGNTSTGRNPLWTILSPTDNSIGGNSWYILRVKQNAVCTNELASPQVFDLTAMYGFGNEPTTVEQFKRDYPQFFDEKLDSIWNVRTSGISTTGKNLFDISKWITSRYDVANGTLVERLSSGAICQGNNGTGDGDSSYSNGWFRPMYYQYPNSIYLQAGIYTLSADYTMIENSVVNTARVNCYLYGDHQYTTSPTSITVGNIVKVKSTYTVEEGYYYPVFTLNSGKAKIENIQIELNSTETTYEPYIENKIDLLSTQTLNGINGVNDYIEVIDKGNGLYDLKKTQNIASVNMGSLGFDADGNNFVTGAISPYIKPPANDNSVGNYICQKYVNCVLSKSFVDGDFGVNSSGYIYFRDSSYSTAAAFKTAVTGTMLYYQLKTPVTTTIATNLTYNQVSAIRTNGGLLLVNDNNNQKYVQPNVIIKSNYQYKS